MPCLALRGVAEGIAKSPSLKAKVLLRGFRGTRISLPSLLIKWTVNSKSDRETEDYTAVDFIKCDSKVIAKFSFVLTTCQRDRPYAQLRPRYGCNINVISDVCIYYPPCVLT